jgi:hypothetical protein
MRELLFNLKMLDGGRTVRFATGVRALSGAAFPPMTAVFRLLIGKQ